MSVVLLSGGVDSAVLLAKLVSEGGAVLALAADYGQRHAAREIAAARAVARHYGVRLEDVPLPPCLFRGSALTGGPAKLSGGATVVPNRNAVFLSLAAALAITEGHNAVCFAAHAGDREVYPDCREPFVYHMDHALRLACGVNLRAPFLAMTKAEVVSLGRELDVPFHLTWSCYAGGEEPCGTCGACVGRREAGL